MKRTYRVPMLEGETAIQFIARCNGLDFTFEGDRVISVLPGAQEVAVVGTLNDSFELLREEEI